MSNKPKSHQVVKCGPRVLLFESLIIFVLEWALALISVQFKYFYTIFSQKIQNKLPQLRYQRRVHQYHHGLKVQPEKSKAGNRPLPIIIALARNRKYLLRVLTTKITKHTVNDVYSF